MVKMAVTIIAAVCVRTSTDTGMGRWLAAGETLLSVIYFCAAIGYVRLSRNRDDHK